MSPTARTLALLREMGYVAAVVERFDHYAKIRIDLFGFVDVVGIHPTEGFLAVQTTSGSNASARVTKCVEAPVCAAWLVAGGRVEVWDWAKRGPRGRRKLWTLRRQRASLVNGAVEFEVLAAESNVENEIDGPAELEELEA